MVSQRPKFSLALFVYSSDFKHKTEEPEADKLHFDTSLNMPRMQEMDSQGSKFLQRGNREGGGGGGAGRRKLLRCFQGEEGAPELVLDS